MTSKDKAKELIKKYALLIWKGKEFEFECYKQCVLIAVDELIDEQTSWQNGQVNPVLYWQEVKQEIENL